ncbi:uncharacterized protein LOC135299148 [Passer domesticus]|uniref:uncharacterized protein LOC135299148 n=1 Tax=Passer domesticus TaxID=48849 RepID=UPI0030FE1C9B
MWLKKLGIPCKCRLTSVQEAFKSIVRVMYVGRVQVNQQDWLLSFCKITEGYNCRRCGGGFTGPSKVGWWGLYQQKASPQLVKICFKANDTFHPSGCISSAGVTEEGLHIRKTNFPAENPKDTESTPPIYQPWYLAGLAYIHFHFLLLQAACKSLSFIANVYCSGEQHFKLCEVLFDWQLSNQPALLDSHDRSIILRSWRLPTILQDSFGSRFYSMTTAGHPSSMVLSAVRDTSIQRLLQLGLFADDGVKCRIASHK